MTMVIVVDVSVSVLDRLVLVLVGVRRRRVEAGPVIVRVMAVVVSMAVRVSHARMAVTMIVPLSKKG